MKSKSTKASTKKVSKAPKTVPAPIASEDFANPQIPASPSTQTQSIITPPPSFSSDATSNTSAPADTSRINTLYICLAIVIAGALVGAGLFFGNVYKIRYGALSGTSDTKTTPIIRPSDAEAKNVAPVTADDHIRGSLSAPVKLIEFSDLECPFCKSVHPTLQQVLAEYQGQVAWIYRHFPLQTLHPKAPKEAEATECAAELGGNEKFWAFVDRMFEVTPSNNRLDPEQLPQIAQDVGLNRKAFESCLSSSKYAQKVQAHLEDATKSGGRGTPYTILVKGDTYVPISGAVPYKQFKSQIDSLLK